MRFWRFCWNTIFLSSQYNPPRFVELVMLLLAMFLLGVWAIADGWQYLVLSLSYIVGSSVTILVREAIAPSPFPRPTQVAAVLLLIVSFYAFVDLAR